MREETSECFARREGEGVAERNSGKKSLPAEVLVGGGQADAAEALSRRKGGACLRKTQVTRLGRPGQGEARPPIQGGGGEKNNAVGKKKL